MPSTRWAAVLLSLGAAGALRLFNSGVCPFAQRAWIALLETRAPFDHVIIDLANKPAEFLALSPTPHAAKVPLLELDDGTVVVESVDVARRIATDFGDRRLLPTGTERHVDAFVELWTGWVEHTYYAVLTAQSEAQARDHGQCAPHARPLRPILPPLTRCNQRRRVCLTRSARSSRRSRNEKTPMAPPTPSCSARHSRSPRRSPGRGSS